MAQPQKKSHAELRAECEARTVRWEWATDKLYALEPYYFEVHRSRRGRRLKKQPKKGYAYGFDPLGRLTIERKLPFSTQSPDEELFIPRGEALVETSRALGSDESVSVGRYTYENGKLVQCTRTHPRGTRSSETFVWKGERPTRVTLKSDRDPRTYTLIHDAKGLLRVRGAGYVTYERQDTPLDELLGAMKARLLAAIPATLARRKLPPLYCVAIAYDEENIWELMPPRLALGLESERHSKIAKGGEYLRPSLWEPYAFEGFADDEGLEIRDAKLDALCEHINQHLWQTASWERAVDALHDVAKGLNAELRSWRGGLTLTPDFVVYATNVNGDGGKGAKRSATPDVLALLEKARLV
jgi:hypothetical protein